jgi:hypothetical protein
MNLCLEAYDHYEWILKRIKNDPQVIYWDYDFDENIIIFEISTNYEFS